MTYECMLSRVWLFVTPWAIACQAPLSMGFSKLEYWWVASLLQENLLNSGPEFYVLVSVSLLVQQFYN